MDTIPVLGIDLGTTNSCVSIWKNNNITVIPDRYGNRTLPSIISYTKNTKYIGNEAKKLTSLNPKNTIYEIKRLIGRKYNDTIDEHDFLTYNIGEVNDKLIIQTSYDILSPEEISAEILKELKFMAQSYLQQPITKAVITVPAYFDNIQREATKDAALIAGLDCIRILSEPTAAALAYGYGMDDKNILIYDLGGGTLDTSLVNINDGVFEVLASSGNSRLGGADFDNKLITYCINEFKTIHNLPTYTPSPLILQELKKECEKAKKILSSTPTKLTTTTIRVKCMDGAQDLCIKINCQQFETICNDLFLLCMKPVYDIVNYMDKESIDEIILVGGATRMPLIRENLKLFFNKEPNTSIDPDEAVSMGAAIHGFILENKTNPFSENVVLLDIVPLSLGVKTYDDFMDIIIPINSTIPITKKRKYTTDTDNETEVLISVYEGERKMTRDNRLVGEFLLTGLEPAPKGIAEIEITFTVDVHGTLTVIAEDLKNNDNKKTLITKNNNKLSKEEINTIIKNAKESELQDYLEREMKQMYYEINDLCTNIINNLKELPLPQNDTIKKEIKELLEWITTNPYNKEQYTVILDKLKNNYSTLILKKSETTYDTIKTKIQATEIFNDDEEDEEGEGGEKEGGERKRALLQLCDQINKTPFINDLLLEIYIKDDITKEEYEKYEKLIKSNKTKLQQFEDLCYEMIDTYDIDDYMEWLLTIKLEIREKELTGEYIEGMDGLFEEKIGELKKLKNGF